MTVDELEVLITANTSALRKEINKTNSTINSLKKTAEKTQSGVTSAFKKLATGIGAIGIGKIIKDSIKTGMDAIESDSLFDTSLGNMADSVREWSNEISNTLGLNAVAMRKNTGVIYNMTTSMGLAQDNALKMSKGISVLTEDMASFYNLNSTEAFNKLRAGLTGETEPLKALGILVDENTIKQVAYSEGIATVGSELTQQQKVLARYVAILKQTGNAQGDLARTINSPANQLRILKNQVSQLGLAFGNILLPVLSAVIPYITAFAKVVTTALNSLAKFLGISTGSSGLGSMSSDIGNMAGGLGDVNTGLTDATKNAKKLKGSLAGFDEMNTLSDNSDTGSSGGGASAGGVGGDLGFNLGDYDAQLGGVTSKVDEIAEKIRKAFSSIADGIDFNKVASSFNRLKKAIEPITTTIFEGLKWAWDNLLVPLAQWSIGDLLPAFLDAVSGALTVLSPIIEDSKEALIWLWDTFLEPIASWTGGVIVDVLTGIGDALTVIGENQVAISILEGLAIAIGIVRVALELYTGSALYLNKITTLGSTIAKGFSSAIGLITSPVGLVTIGIGLLIAGIILLIKNWDTVKEVAGKVWDKIKEIWGIVANWFSKNIIEPLKNFFSSLWDKIKNGASIVWNFIKGVFVGVANWFNTTLIQPVKNFFVGMWDGLKHGARDAWSGIKSVFSSVTSWFKNTFTTAWQGVKNVFSTGSKIFEGIKEGISSVFKTVVNGLIDGINKVIAVPFNAINKALRTVRDISIAGVEPFKGLISLIDVPQIPKLARGGIVDNPTYAMIGEAGKEAVMPLERNTGWIDQLANKLADKIGGNGNPIQLTVKLGEDTIFNKFIDYANSKSFETNGEVFSI